MRFGERQKRSGEMHGYLGREDEFWEERKEGLRRDKKEFGEKMSFEKRKKDIGRDNKTWGETKEFWGEKDRSGERQIGHDGRDESRRRDLCSWRKREGPEET